jgi:TonB family protein
MVNREPEIHLLLEIETEAARWRRRTMFLLSVVLHGLLALLILVSPDLFRRGAEMMGIDLVPAPEREHTLLWIPPEVLRSLREPEEPPEDPRILSDRDRRAQGRAPLIDPFGDRQAFSPGTSPLPEIAGGAPPVPPPLGSPPAGAPAVPPPPAKEEPREQAQLRLEDVPRPGSGDSRLQLPLATPGDAIRQSLEAAARGRATGPAEGPGDGAAQFRNFNPNFSTEAPTILSDTRGVDFGPYLARVVWAVRRNWYSMIPVSARLGQKGRVAIVFEIRRDGSVPELRLVASSGSEPLDRAALASIRASNPFPPLPDEFTGPNLVLQFIFLYNMGYSP